MEEWRPIPDIPRYEASSKGRIRRIRYRVLRPYYGHRKSDYPRVTLGGRRYMVHILVARAFIGECPSGYEHNHKDGDKRNASPNNLEFVTRSENILHKYRVLGVTSNQGAKHGMAKLTDTDVVAIRAAGARGEPQKSIAKRFSVSVPTVSMIINRRTWRHHMPPPT